MGQSVLKTHWIDGKKYCPYGYFGVFSNDYFAMPVEDALLANRFCRDFRLERVRGPGLSVVVPFPDRTINEESIAGELITHYFYPILTGDLVAELVSGSGSYVLDQSSLRDIANRVFGTKDRQKIENLSKLFDVVEWSRTLKSEDFAVPDVVSPGKPSWEGIAFSKGTLDWLRDAYEAKRHIALQIPVTVKEGKREPQKASFRVLMHRDPDQRRGEVYFVRQGITILNPNAPRERSVRAVVVIEDPALSKLLGDAENPAHTEWQERSEKFRGKYEYGPSCLRFVKHAVAGIVRILTAPCEERDRNLLKDVFFVPRRKEEEETGAEPKAGGGRIKSTGADAGAPGNKPQPIRLERVAGGFKISADPEADGRRRLVTVRLAYAVRRGDALKRYVPEDFRLDSNHIHVQYRDVDIRERVENRLVFETRSKAFSVEVKGFDTHRDLVIQLTHEDLDS